MLMPCIEMRSTNPGLAQGWWVGILYPPLLREPVGHLGPAVPFFLRYLRSLSSKAFPYHKYGCGNNASLNVPNITGRLSEWYYEHYGSHVMALTVVSNHSLDELQAWAEKSFQPVPDRGATVPRFNHRPRPFPESAARLRAFSMLSRREARR